MAAGLTKSSLQSFWHAHMAAGKMACGAGSYQQASRQFQAALDLLEANSAPAPMQAKTLNGLARAIGGLGRNEQAEQLLRRAIAIEDLNDCPETAITSRVELAALLRETGRFAESESLCNDSLRLVATLKLPYKSLEVALLRQLAIIYLETNRPSDCETMIAEGLTEAEEDVAMGKCCLDYGQLLSIQSLCLIDQHRFDKAVSVARQASQILEMQRGTVHPRNSDLNRVFERHLERAGRRDLIPFFTFTL